MTPVGCAVVGGACAAIAAPLAGYPARTSTHAAHAAGCFGAHAARLLLDGGGIARAAPAGAHGAPCYTQSGAREHKAGSFSCKLEEQLCMRPPGMGGGSMGGGGGGRERGSSWRP